MRTRRCQPCLHRVHVPRWGVPFPIMSEHQCPRWQEAGAGVMRYKHDCRLGCSPRSEVRRSLGGGDIAAETREQECPDRRDTGCAVGGTQCWSLQGSVSPGRHLGLFPNIPGTVSRVSEEQAAQLNCVFKSWMQSPEGPGGNRPIRGCFEVQALKSGDGLGWCGQSLPLDGTWGGDQEEWGQVEDP